MTLWPRSLFGRLILLLVTVVALAAITTMLVFKRDREALLAQQFNDTKVMQMKGLRTSLDTVDGPHRRETLARLEREYNVRIIPESERPTVGLMPIGTTLHELEQRLRDDLGEGTEVRVSPRGRQLFVRVQAAGDGYWIGFPLPRSPQDIPSRALAWVKTGFAQKSRIAIRIAFVPVWEKPSCTRMAAGIATAPINDAGARK